ncbi:transmembrane protein 214 isoform X1 [Drosophila albomicans]|uniref:Transmembrane protein 214 isoform X1 n=1 Tax=Drosophila albomicans TaxID=7291 RepID=A0A6P8WT81_DROAB|nr:transmembrane protein 214 isoform X1 [Drosophila albomicans]
MSNNQWEVVAKSRKQRNLEKKVTAHTEQKRIAAQLPKLEELLPTQQYRNLFGNHNNNNNNKSHSPAKSTSSVASTSSKSKSPRKSNNNAKSNATAGGGAGGNGDAAKKQAKQTSTKPKTLEQAMKQITPDDFAAQVAQVKISCPGSELRWLSNIASYLNGALSYDCDPVFSGRSAQYPSNLASSALKQSILEFLSSVGETNLEYFFYSLLDSMATELNNGQHVAGYKFVLQLIGQHWPSICSHNMAKTALLRNSYQNRSNICLSILWAIGQGGHQSLTEGVKVWQNLMLPNLELRSFSKFVVEHIERVLLAAVARKTDDHLLINQQEFFYCYNSLNSTYNNLPKELQQSLKRSARLLLQRYIQSPVKQANIFLTLLREIKTDGGKQRNEIDGCISCLLSSGADDCFKVWRMNYKKQQLPSLLLLRAIDNDWTDSTKLLAQSEAYHAFLQDVRGLNEELQSAKRKDIYVDDLQSVLKTVQEKSSAQQKKNKQNASQKKKCGCCKWALGSIFIIALIAGALCYDTETNGKGVFEKSATGKILKNAGVLPHVQKAWYVTMGASARGYKWAEEHVPPYAEPALKTGCNLWKLARNACCNAYTNGLNYWRLKWPAVAKFIDQYVPDLSKKLEAFAAGAKDVAVNSYEKSATIIKEKVLVGRFSPENINQALNQTRNAALEYYNQFHKKVDAYAKLK